MNGKYIRAIIFGIAAVIFGSMTLMNKANAADQHVCTNIEYNLGILYDNVAKAESMEQIVMIEESLAASSLSDEQKDVVQGGLVFLVNYGLTYGQLPERSMFIDTGKTVCKDNYGQVSDGKNV